MNIYDKIINQIDFKCKPIDMTLYSYVYFKTTTNPFYPIDVIIKVKTYYYTGYFYKCFPKFHPASYHNVYSQIWRILYISQNDQRNGWIRIPKKEFYERIK